MIKVEVKIVDQKVKSLILLGHAGQADVGEDVVCAGASSCFIGALNALNEVEKCSISYDKGYGSVVVNEDLQEHDEIVLDVVIKQLQCIAESYPNYLEVKIMKEGAK